MVQLHPRCSLLHTILYGTVRVFLVVFSTDKSTGVRNRFEEPHDMRLVRHQMPVQRNFDTGVHEV